MAFKIYVLGKIIIFMFFHLPPNNILKEYSIRRIGRLDVLIWLKLVISILMSFFSLCYEGLVMDQKAKQMMKQQRWLWVLILVGLIGLPQKVLSSFKRLDREWLFNSSRLRKDCAQVELSSANMVRWHICASCFLFLYAHLLSLWLRSCEKHTRNHPKKCFKTIVLLYLWYLNFQLLLYSFFKGNGEDKKRQDEQEDQEGEEDSEDDDQADSEEGEEKGTEGEDNDEDEDSDENFADIEED